MRPHNRFRGAGGLLAGSNQGLRRFDLLFDLSPFVVRDRARRFRRLLQALAGAPRRGELGFRLKPVRFGGQHFGFRFGNLSGDFRRAQFDEKLPLLDDAAAVHRYAIHITGHPSMERDTQEGLKLAGQFDGL